MTAATATARPANERRSAGRRRSLLGGKLTTPDTRRSSSCTVRNLSPTGAKLTLAGAEPFPSDAWLVLGKEGLAMRTRTVWRQGAEIGVDFVEMHDLSRAVPAHIAGLRRLWVDQLPR